MGRPVGPGLSGGTKGEPLRSKVLISVLILVAAAYAREPRHYQTGVLVRMDSVSCGYAENSGTSFAGEMLGTDSAQKKTQELLCPEYLLQTDHVIYRIRPKDQKHPVLLPVGQQAQFRLDRDKMILRVEDLDNKDRDYVVLSMTPRQSHPSGEDTSLRLNHLQ